MPLQTATMTDLRFRAKKVLRTAKTPVWIFSRGKKVGVMMNALLGENVLKAYEQKRMGVAPKIPFLKAAKACQFDGPRNLSQNIDDAIYG